MLLTVLLFAMGATAQEMTWQPHPDTGKKFEVTGYVIGFEPFESEQDCKGRSPKEDTRYFIDVGNETKFDMSHDPVLDPGTWYFVTVYSYNGERRSEMGPYLCVETYDISPVDELESNETYGGNYEQKESDRESTFSLGTVSPPSSGPRGNGKADVDPQLQSDGRKRNPTDTLASVLGTGGRTIRQGNRNLTAGRPMEDGRRDENLEHDNVDSGLGAGSTVLLPNDSTQRDPRIGSHGSRVQDDGDESPSSHSYKNRMILLGLGLLAAGVLAVAFSGTPNEQRSRLRNCKAENAQS